MWKCESGYRDFYKISKKNTACAFNHIEENTRKERKPMPQQTSIKAKDWPPSLHTYINFLGTFKERVIFFYKLVHASCTLFWDVILGWYHKFLGWRSIIIVTYFLSGKLVKTLFWNNEKFVYLNVITNFRPKITSESIARRHEKVLCPLICYAVVCE